MNAIARDRCALVLVDYQQRLMPTIHEAEAVVDEALFVADVAQALGVPAFGTEQNPAGLGPNLPAVRERCARTLAKTHFDACRDGLLEALREVDARTVVIAGCEAHVCLCQTALGLRRAGLDVFVVASACGSRRPEDHARAMQRLAQAGATVVSAEMVAFEWLDHCRDPAFRTVLELLKARARAGR